MFDSKNIPDGFEFRFHPFCHGCTKYEPEVTRYISDNKNYLNIITCENQNLCEHLSRRIKEKAKEN